MSSCSINYFLKSKKIFFIENLKWLKCKESLCISCRWKQSEKKKIKEYELKLRWIFIASRIAFETVKCDCPQNVDLIFILILASQPRVSFKKITFMFKNKLEQSLIEVAYEFTFLNTHFDFLIKNLQYMKLNKGKAR